MSKNVSKFQHLLENLSDPLIKSSDNKAFHDQLFSKLVSLPIALWQEHLNNKNQLELHSFLISHLIESDTPISTEIIASVTSNLITDDSQLPPHLAKEFYKKFSSNEAFDQKIEYEFQKLFIKNNMMEFDIAKQILINLYNKNYLQDENEQLKDLFEHFVQTNPEKSKIQIFEQLTCNLPSSQQDFIKLIVLNISWDHLGSVSDICSQRDSINTSISNKMIKIDEGWYDENSNGLKYLMQNLFEEDSKIILQNKFHDILNFTNPNLRAQKIDHSIVATFFDKTFKFFIESYSTYPKISQDNESLLYKYLYFSFSNYTDSISLINSLPTESLRSLASKKNCNIFLEQSNSGLIKQLLAHSENEFLFNFISFKFFETKQGSSTYEKQQIKSFKKQIIERFHDEALILNYFQTQLKLASEIIVSDLIKEPLKDLPLTSDTIGKTICNNDGFDTRSIPKNCVKGSQLKMDDGTPIGYNIHIPDSGKIDAILVAVYGGGAVTYGPQKLSSVQKYMISKNIACITLNLADLLDLKVFQLNMPDDLHLKLHASIHYFHTLITTKPEQLHPDLSSLSGKEIYLSGGSFGGKMTLSHAGLYPDSFKGYLSFDGGLSLQMGSLSSSIKDATRFSNSNTNICSTNVITEIKQPIHVIHNIDDNNVNIKQSIDYLQKLFALGKGNLISCFFINKGNVIPLGMKVHKLNNKGHFFPTDEVGFTDTVESVYNFIVNGVSKLSNLSEFRVNKIEMIANENYRSANLEEKFITKVYRDYLDKSVEFHNNKAAKQSILDNWEHYSKLYQAIKYIDSLNDYDSEMTNLVSKISEAMLYKAVNKIFHQLSEYFYEINGMMPIRSSFDQIKNKEAFYKSYLELMTNHNDSAVKKFLFSKLVIANPELVSESIDESLKIEIDQVKINFLAKLDIESGHLQSMWRDTFKLVAKGLKANKSASSQFNENSINHDSLSISEHLNIENYIEVAGEVSVF